MPLRSFGETSAHLRKRRRDQGGQVTVGLLTCASMLLQVSLYWSCTRLPNTNTIVTITAAIAATMRPSRPRWRLALQDAPPRKPPPRSHNINRLLCRRARGVGVDGGAGVVEDILDQTAQSEYHNYDQRGNGGDEQAVSTAEAPSSLRAAARILASMAILRWLLSGISRSRSADVS